MFVVDTNILVYAAESSFVEHKKCKKLVEDWRVSPLAWYTTWGIIYEFVRVVTHRRVFLKPWTIENAWGFVDSLLDSPGLKVISETERHLSVVRETMESLNLVSGNLVHDMHTAILMLEHGIRRIYTRDMDFHRFSFIETIDPLTEL